MTLIKLPIVEKPEAEEASVLVKDYWVNPDQVSYLRKYNEASKQNKTALYMTGNPRPFIVNLSEIELLSILKNKPEA
jgi:hypothetical protein